MGRNDATGMAATPARTVRARRAALWAVVALGLLYSGNDGPIPAMFYLLVVAVIYTLVRFARRTTSGD
jgi:hypothetical protein